MNIKRILLWSFVMLISMASLVVADSFPANLTITTDSSWSDSFLSEFAPDDNYGARTTAFPIGRNPTTAVNGRYIINLTDVCGLVPAYTVFTNASFAIKYDTCDSGASSKYNAYPVNELWEEGTQNGQPGALCWNESTHGNEWTGGRVGGNQSMNHSWDVFIDSPVITAVQGGLTNISLDPAYLTQLCNNDLNGYTHGIMIIDKLSEDRITAAAKRCGFLPTDGTSPPKIYLEYHVEAPAANTPPTVVINNADPTSTNTTLLINWTTLDAELDNYETNITLSNSTYSKLVVSDLPNTVATYSYNFGLESNGNYTLTVTSFENDTAELYNTSDSIVLIVDKAETPVPPATLLDQQCPSLVFRESLVEGVLTFILLYIILISVAIWMVKGGKA